MDRSASLLTTAAALDALVDAIRDAGRFAIDTEFVGERTYRPQLALVQIALPDRVALIDAQALPDLTLLWRQLADPAVETVVHAGEQEARFCWDIVGAVPDRLFDVQLAAGFVGPRYPLSLAALVQEQLHARLRQGQTRTDWTRRPLSAAQLDYAVEDVRYLLTLRQRLGDRLEALDRPAWLEEESRHRLQALEDDLLHPRWWRVSGAERLGRRELAALRELYLWREAVAEERDLPRKRILPDHLIMSAVQALPSDEEELRRLRGFERYGRRDIAALLRCLRTAQGLPQDELPPRRSRGGRTATSAATLTPFLQTVMETAANERQVAPALVGGAADLRELVHWRLHGGATDSLPVLLQGWRGAVCGDLLQAALAGRLSVRIKDPASAQPLAVETVAVEPVAK